MADRVVTKQDWEGVRRTMKFYNRTAGYVKYIGDVLTFFDAKPADGGVWVSLGNVNQYITSYD